MKILLLNTVGNSRGGVENGIKETMQVLLSHNHEVKLFSSNYGNKKDIFSNYTFKLIQSNNPLKVFYYYFNFFSYFRLKQVLIEFQPDIVHIHSLYYLSPSVLFLLKNYKTIITVNGPEEYFKKLILWLLPYKYFKNNNFNTQDINYIGKLHYYYHIYIQRPLYMIGLKNVDLFISVSKYFKKQIDNEVKPIITLYNGIKLLNQNPLSFQNNIYYVGRLEIYKGIDVLIKAMPSVLDKIPQVKLYIIGEGDYKDELISMVASLMLKSKIQFLGKISHGELERYYANSDIVIIPSVWPEAFGNVGIEAMSVGRPVIASRVGGIPEWLDDGKTGFLIEPGNSEQIAEKVIQLLSNKKLLEQMSRNARKKAEKFSIEKHVDKLEKIYLKVIKQYKTKESS